MNNFMPLEHVDTLRNANIEHAYVYDHTWTRTAKNTGNEYSCALPNGTRDAACLVHNHPGISRPNPSFIDYVCVFGTMRVKCMIVITHDGWSITTPTQPLPRQMLTTLMHTCMAINMPDDDSSEEIQNQAAKRTSQAMLDALLSQNLVSYREYQFEAQE